MKQVIKIKMINEDIQVPTISEDGEWIDLRAAKTINLNFPIARKSRNDKGRVVDFHNTVIPLGIAMKLPKGYEAVVNVRSSFFKNYHSMLVNSQGVIDNSYCGDNDQWFAHIVSFSNAVIEEGDRICQFRIQLSQKATIWQKLKWLFSNGIKIKVVKQLKSPDRGGHGHSGKK